MKLQGPQNTSGFSHDGKSYEPDADGCIDVPPEVTGFALSHGFTALPVAPAPAPTTTPPAAEGALVNFSKLTKKQLVAFAKENLNLDLDEALKAADLIAAIEAALEAKTTQTTEGEKTGGAE